MNATQECGAVLALHSQPQAHTVLIGVGLMVNSQVERDGK